mmetsp:Transcript_11684/g.25059  ORF Transcript_11684/g.25059 Transcript_11684/m.25059 type:complete len:101 (-) Transcript_11684:39-341(-)
MLRCGDAAAAGFTDVAADAAAAADAGLCRIREEDGAWSPTILFFLYISLCCMYGWRLFFSCTFRLNISLLKKAERNVIICVSRNEARKDVTMGRCGEDEF